MIAWFVRYVRRAQHRLCALLLLSTVTLTACGMSIEATGALSIPTATSESESLGRTGVSSATPSATAMATVAPSATIAPTATATATPLPTATATPDMTATAAATIAAEWSASTQQVTQIDVALGSVGTRFQNGSVSLGASGAQLAGLDQQAAAVGKTIDALPALPGVDAGTLQHYRQTVDQWTAAIHALDVAVASHNIFGAPAAANHLEQVADDLEQQTAALHLPPA